MRVALEERDAAIARLEQTLTEQQAHVAALQDALERAKFQARILEQSYSTQLGAAGKRAAASERLAADQRTRITELEACGEKLAKELAEARPVHEPLEREAESIDEMLASFAVARERPLLHDRDGVVDPPAVAQAVGEMLPPEVMFAAKGRKRARAAPRACAARAAG